MRASIVLGLVNGLSYALLAMGLVLVFKVGRFVNFAHAQMGVIPALLLGKAAIDWSVPWIIAFPVSVAVGAGVGALIDVTVIRRLRDHSPATLLIATIGVAQVLLAITFWSWIGPNRNAVLRQGYPLPFEVRLEIDALTLTAQHVLTLLLVPLLGGGLILVLRYTILGKAIRAVASNADAAGLAGISVGRISTLTWSIAGGFAAVSAILQAPGEPTFDTEAFGPSLLLRALGAAALAGFTSLPLAAFAGVALGGLEGTVLYVTQNGGVAEAWMLGAIIIGLLIRGRSMAGTRRTEELVGSPPELHPVPELVRDRPLFVNAGRLTAGLALAIGLIAPLLPLWQSSAKQFLLTLVLVHALVAVSLVVLSGWAGQISLGQFAFVGLGAYVGARLLNDGWSLPLALVAVGFLGAAVAVLIGLPALRLAGLTLAVTTVGLAVTGPSWLFRQPWISDTATPSIAAPSIPGIGTLGSPLTVYYLSLAVLVLALIGAGRLRRGAPGRLTIATRDNPDALASFGVSPLRVKLTTFALSGFLAAVGGVLFLVAWRTVSIDLFRPQSSFLSLSIAVVGGMTSLAGAVLGALVVFGIPALSADWTASLFASSLQLQLFLGGFGLLATQLLTPGGLASLAARAWSRFGSIVAAELDAANVGERPELVVGPRSEPEILRTGLTVARASEPLGTDTTGPGIAAPARPGRVGPSGSGGAGPVLDVSGVSVVFGGIRAVDRVDLVVEPGEILGLIGTNGAGKSTLLDAISGVVESTEGRVRLAGADVTGQRPEVRARLGMSRTFQSARLFAGLTVRETLQVAASGQHHADAVSTMLGVPWVRRSERRSLDRVEQVIERFGLDPWADVPIAALSTGTRRICDLAAQTVGEPRLLLLDEPAGGVAQREAEQIGPLLRQIRDEVGCALVIIEHDMPLLMGVADRVVCMERGAVIAQGTPAQVRENPRVVTSYLGTNPTAIARTGTAPVAAPTRPRRRRSGRPLVADRSRTQGGDLR